MNHGDLYERFAALGRAFIVLGEAAVAVEPPEGPFHNPALGLGYEPYLPDQLPHDLWVPKTS